MLWMAVTSPPHISAGVDGMDAVVEHVIAGIQVGRDHTLIEAANGVDDGTALQTFLTQLHHMGQERRWKLTWVMQPFFSAR